MLLVFTINSLNFPAVATLEYFVTESSWDLKYAVRSLQSLCFLTLTFIGGIYLAIKNNPIQALKLEFEDIIEKEEFDKEPKFRASVRQGSNCARIFLIIGIFKY